MLLLTFTKAVCRPGASNIHDKIIPAKSSSPYTILELVEFLQLGQQTQHKLHAALVTQQAN